LAQARALAEQFDDLTQQHEADTLGMWIFLVTEILFFGGLFMGYTIYRTTYPHAFALGSHYNEPALGAMMTAVLLLSSFTMALAVRFAQLGKPNLVIPLLFLTMVLGAAFLGIKFYEYHLKWVEHVVPGFNFTGYTGPEAEHVQLFICFYFLMTGLHALHMIIGIGIMTVMAILTWRGRITTENYFPIEISGLYWHFVDIIWIFLFPLLYLIDIHR
jgi:cytochrome c oxidase subunit 3